MKTVREFQEAKIVQKVCISVIIILGGFFAYTWYKSGQEKSIIYLCQSRLRGIADALQTYYEENSSYPRSLDILIITGESTTRNCQCPMQSHAIDEFPDYAYVCDLPAENPKHWPVAFDLAENHGDGTRNVIFRSREVRLLTEKEFCHMMKTFRIEHRREKDCDPVIIYPIEQEEP